MPERILITGGGGFIGARLARRLIADGRDVHCLLRPDRPYSRLADLAGRYTPQWADLNDTAAVRRAVASARPEVVYHLAAAGVSPAPGDRAALLETNVLGAARLVDALRRHEYRAFVHAGSGAEYGPSDCPLSEDAPLNPATDYGAAKAAASLLCLDEARRGRPVVVVRLFGVYGSGEAPGRLVPSVMAACLRGEPARVTAGTQLRDFVFVEDVVDLLNIAAQAPVRPGCVLHAAGGVGVTVRRMVETICEAAGGPPPLFGAVDTRPDEPPYYLASIEKTAALTGWRPRFDLRAGVENTWDWFRRDAGLAARWAG